MNPPVACLTPASLLNRCAQAVNGHPSCANKGVLIDLLKKRWNPDAIITTDCGAVSNLQGPPVRAPSPEAAAAYAINNGTDIEMGSTVFTEHLVNATRQGLVKESTVREAARRTQRQLFALGRFDPVGSSAWEQLGAESINSSAHRQVQYEAGCQGLVLLKNTGGALPLRSGRHTAVVGPQGVARHGLLSDYYGDEVCFTSSCSGHDCFDCIATVAEAMRGENSHGVTTAAGGVDVDSTDTSRISAALALARAAKQVVLVLGIDKTVEHEGRDRTDTALPGLQEDFARQVLALGKPTVLVLVNGGALAIDGLMSRKEAAPYAIVEAFNPNVGGAACLASSLFGRENRWGKLPVTMYPHSFIGQKEMADFDMSSGIGRTYKYYQGTPLFPFGFGLSLTTFSLSCTTHHEPGRDRTHATLHFDCLVRNTGDLQGDEVIMIWHAISDDIRNQLDHPAPKRELLDFARVRVAPGGSSQVRFGIDVDSRQGVVDCPSSVPAEEPHSSDLLSLRIVNRQGSRVLCSGYHDLTVSRGVGNPHDEVHYGVRLSKLSDVRS